MPVRPSQRDAHKGRAKLRAAAPRAGLAPVELGIRRPDSALAEGLSLRGRCLSSTALVGVLIAGLMGSAHANPTGGTVVAGGATISQPSSSLTNVTETTNRAVINWQ